MPVESKEYVRKLMDNQVQDNDRTAIIRKKIKQEMQKPRKGWHTEGSILDQENVKKDIVFRKAVAIKKKLTDVPIEIWEKQPVAGSLYLPGEGLMLSGTLPEYATEKEKEQAKKQGLSKGSIVGHIVPDYEKLLDLGINGLLEKVKAKADLNEDSKKTDFYQALMVSLEGLQVFVQRHADLCRRVAADCQEAGRKAELQQLSRNLEVVAKSPARNLWQAVNIIWLTHLAFQLTGNHLAIGRIDSLLNPYLEKDLQEERLTINSAQELFDCFFLKFNERSRDNKVVEEEMDLKKVQQRMDENWKKRSPFAHSTQKYNVRDSVDATNHWLQNVIVGGVKPEDGSDNTSLATIMSLEAFRRNQMTNPCTTVRFNKNTPQYLYQYVALVLRKGGGLPAIFNDEVIIPSLLKNGFPPEAARDYTNDGCWEVLVPGKTDFYFDRFNMLRCLEWTLNRGRSRIDGKQEAPDPGDPSQINNFEELIEKFQAILDYELQGIMDKINNNFGKRAMIAPTPLLSALLAGPLASGKDMTAGGARFKTYGLIAEGMSHVIDSLAAIKKVIFQEEKASMADLIAALDKNFKGYQGLRTQLQQAPKYGNNDPYADKIGLKIISYFTERVKEFNKNYPAINFLPGIGTFSWYIAIGEGVGPTPDGRLKAEAVSSNFSPSQGVVAKGITGALNSFSKMNLEDLPVGSPVDLRISSKLIEGDAGRKRLAGLLQSFIEMGGNMLTLSVADVETLRKAQCNPDQYSHLRVRMGGWSAYFTMLSKEQQEHHIKKEENL